MILISVDFRRVFAANACTSARRNANDTVERLHPGIRFRYARL
jgi:hypothetical protein